MKAVMAVVPPDWLDWRRSTGADQYDEMWEGVLHMPPMPNRDHQDLEGEIESWLRIHWARPFGNKVFHQINLTMPGAWPSKNYRIPDLVLLTPACFHIDRNEYFDGPPTAVVEIRSADDETYDKFPFYAKLGVPEVWVVDRDTREPEVHVLTNGEYVRQLAQDGWVVSPATQVAWQWLAPRSVALQIVDDPATYYILPEA